ncbi:MAG TPA: hypothetical protein VM580_28475 [Labilithrix sp.]|nr:hypothetical protein [Labilithrix sp.]
MKVPPRRCVVDTNVTTTANGANRGASAACVAASARALYAVMAKGHVFIDDGGRIVAEYRKNLNAKGQPGPGDAFFKWLLTHEWSSEKVTRVAITPTGPDEFAELPMPRKGVVYDPSDRKFLAVAAAHDEHPPILQSFDSKWWGWRKELSKIKVKVHFLCERDIAKKHAEKMGR